MRIRKQESSPKSVLKNLTPKERKAQERVVNNLNNQLKNGKISQAEYNRQMGGVNKYTETTARYNLTSSQQRAQRARAELNRRS